MEEVTMPKKRKLVYQSHHVAYEELPDFTVKLRRWVHLAVTRIGQLKSTPEHLEEILNIQMALQFIARRMMTDIKEEDNGS